jgi:hypothetical protein
MTTPREKTYKTAQVQQLAEEAAEILRDGPSWEEIGELPASSVAASAQAFAIDIMERIARGEDVENISLEKTIAGTLSTTRYSAAIRFALHNPEPATTWAQVFERARVKLNLQSDRDLRRSWREYERARGVRTLLPFRPTAVEAGVKSPKSAPVTK